MYPRKVRAAILLALVLICFCSVAQKNYLPGTIVTLKGDTLRGLIDYRNWELNPRNIYFKENPDGTPRSFGVNDILSFGIPGRDRYIRSIVWKDMQSINLNQLSDISNDAFIKDTVFARLLVRGDKLSLYELVDEKEHFFIQEGNDSLQELQYKIFRDSANNSMAVTRTIFIDQLKKYTFNSSVPDKVIRKIDNASYKEKDLTEIVTLLNSSVEYSTVTALPKQKVVSVFGGAGISYNSISFSGGDQNLEEMDFSPSTGFVVSAGVDLFSQRRFQNLFFRFELSYRDNNYTGTSGNSKYELEKVSLGVSLSALYTIVRTNSARIYAGAGCAYDFISYPKNTYGLRFNKSWAAPFLRAGFIFRKHFEATVISRLEKEFDRYPDLKVTAISSSFSLQYHF